MLLDDNNVSSLMVVTFSELQIGAKSLKQCDITKNAKKTFGSQEFDIV